MFSTKLKRLEEIYKLKVSSKDRLHSASHQEILEGLTTDIYWFRAYEILDKLNLLKTSVTMEIFCREKGVLAGVEEVLFLLKDKKVKIWGLSEGEEFQAKEVIMRLTGPYEEFGYLETPLLGMLASPSGWATAARECKRVAGDKMVICFGARHIHPAVAPVMERAAIIGGIDDASCILGAKLVGKEPKGTIPHSAILIIGDTVKLAKAYDEIMSPDIPRIILIDTFKDEGEEAVRVAEALKERLGGIRLDTPNERGGVTPDLVKEVRVRLDRAGFPYVKIFVSGGLHPEKIKLLSEAGADAFGVGGYISAAPPLEMTMDIRCVQGKPLAKRGRTPGETENPRLKRLK